MSKLTDQYKARRELWLAADAKYHLRGVVDAIPILAPSTGAYSGGRANNDMCDATSPHIFDITRKTVGVCRKCGAVRSMSAVVVWADNGTTTTKRQLHNEIIALSRAFESR